MFETLVIIKTSTDAHGDFYFLVPVSFNNIPSVKEEHGFKKWFNDNTVYICDEVIDIIYNDEYLWKRGTAIDKKLLITRYYV